MATIVFTNNNNPNPGLEDVLDQNGDIITSNATTFEIRNNNVGIANNFIFRFTSATADFAFTGTTPTAGTITSIKILDATGGDDVIPSASISSKSMLGFWTALQFSGLTSALGVLLAGDLLTPASNTYTGSNGNDRLTTFGLNGITSPDIETLNGGGGDDVLTYIASRATLAAAPATTRS